MKAYSIKSLSILSLVFALLPTVSYSAPSDAFIPVMQLLLLEDSDASAIGAPGNLIHFSGSIDTTDKQWDRLLENCTSENNGTDHFYDTFQIINNTGATQKIEILASWLENEVDGYLHLVKSSFNPANPILGNCITGDDDFGLAFSLIDGGSNDHPSIEPGEVLTIIASTFHANDSIGSYTIDIETLTE
jgi:hypothetical protein